MGNNNEKYKKNCVDEINWVKINQLYESTLQISNQCFQYKKICVGVLAIVITALLKLSPKAELHQISLVCIFICIGFWIADATAYYFQKSNRLKIEKCINEIKENNSIDTDEEGEATSWGKAFCNLSMSLYFYIMLICIIFIHVNLL